MSECRFAATADGLALSGELLFANATAAYVEGLRLLRSSPCTRIDVSAVSAIDSAGLAVLLAWCAASQPPATVAGLPKQALALARVGGVLPILSAEAR